MREINGIPYIQINSMSYKWVGSEHQRQRFAPHIEHAYPAFFFGLRSNEEERHE